MRKNILKIALFAVLLTIALAMIGYYAIKSSGYIDVSELVKFEQDRRVTVKGKLVTTEYDQRNRVLYLVLEGERGGRIIAVVSADYIEKKYGPVQYLKWDPNNIVLQGIYRASQKTLEVTEILQGCHTTYQQEPVGT